MHQRFTVQVHLTITISCSVLQVSSAIARQLRLVDSKGTVDPDRVACFVDTSASSPGQTWLEAYVWLSPSNCQATAEIWQNQVSSKPQALFNSGTDPQLSAAVQNVTSLQQEPTAAQYVKMGIHVSRNSVENIIVHGTVVSSGSSSGSSHWFDGNSSLSEGPDGSGSSTGSSSSSSDPAQQDYISSPDGIYMMSPFAPGPNFTGLLVMGITTISVFMVLALLTIMSKWAERRARHEQEAAADAAVQEATAAAAAAAERFRNAETAIAVAAAVAGGGARAGVRDSDPASISSSSSRSNSGPL
jgi:hypothetical protein